MSTPRLTLPLSLDWTPAQALAVYGLLQALSDALWERYEAALLEQLAHDPSDPTQAELFDFNDPLPF
jgi:hypothetical protein